MTETIWTPAPWEARRIHPIAGNYYFIHATRNNRAPRYVATVDATSSEDQANAELIALAPEMAEAILALAEPQAQVVDEAWAVLIQPPDAVLELAEKLRKIGGKQ